MASILANRDISSVKVTKVKGHASLEDVRGGLVKVEDKFGNDSADSLAVAGAARNQRNNKRGLHQHRAILFTIAVQKMMLSIATARASAVKAASATATSPEAEEEGSDSSSKDSSDSSDHGGSTTTTSSATVAS